MIQRCAFVRHVSLRWRVALTTAITIAGPAPAASQAATLMGAVRDTAGRPIPGGEVLGLTSRRLTVASTTGRFLFSDLAAGPEVFVIRALGFRPERLAVALAPGDTIEIEAVLQPVAQILPQLVIEVEGKVFRGRLAEIAKRTMASGAAASSFIDREEIDRWAPFDLGDVFRRAGLLVTNNEVSCPRLAPRLSQSQPAPNVAVYLDGALLQESQRVGVDIVPVRWLEAIEIYRSAATRPIEYHSPNSSCTIALWTRQ